MSFGCKGDNFGFSSRSPKRLIQAKVISDIEKIRERLERATVECDDFETIFDRYDRSGTCFFCDPPYYGSEDCYEVAFDQADHERLVRALIEVEGAWLVTYNDCAWVRQHYSAFCCYAVTADYTVGKGKPRPGHQLIITNYELDPAAIKAAPKSLVCVERLDQICTS